MGRVNNEPRVVPLENTRFAWAGGTFFPVVLLFQFFVLAGNRFWFYILLLYLEYYPYLATGATLGKEREMKVRYKKNFRVIEKKKSLFFHSTPRG
jgi:hypothetical protein